MKRNETLSTIYMIVMMPVVLFGLVLGLLISPIILGFGSGWEWMMAHVGTVEKTEEEEE